MSDDLTKAAGTVVLAKADLDGFVNPVEHRRKLRELGIPDDIEAKASAAKLRGVKTRGRRYTSFGDRRYRGNDRNSHK